MFLYVHLLPICLRATTRGHGKNILIYLISLRHEHILTINIDMPENLRASTLPACFGQIANAVTSRPKLNDTPL